MLGRTVRHVDMPLWMFYKAARMDGFDAFVLSQMGSFLRDHDRGAFELGGPTDDVLETTSRPSESFEVITRRYANRPEAQRTLGNFLGTVARFMSVPMRPGFDEDRFVRLLRMPQPERAVLSADSAVWRKEHGIAPNEPATPRATRTGIQAIAERRQPRTAV